ncbi:hypothetical protein BSKO_07430 [Bryopsis sp. KO-2023]|nr:hypothetical protein BSKO_07430 [Bryopsis sp. KO-2023]
MLTSISGVFNPIAANRLAQLPSLSISDRNSPERQGVFRQTRVGQRRGRLGEFNKCSRLFLSNRGGTVVAASIGEVQNERTGENFRKVVLPNSLVLLVCNMDRICLSVVMLAISTQFGWAEGTQGMIQSAFLWGYAATQVLGGVLADKYGGKSVMAVGVGVFSVASLLLPVVLSPGVRALGFTIPLVLFSRVLVGLGEGVTMPAMTSLVSQNIPPKLKSTALGLVFLGFNCGSACGLLLSSWLMANYGWQSVFYAFGCIGFPLLLFWINTVPSKLRVRDPRMQTKGQSLSMGKILRTPAAWAVVTATIVNHWGYFICLGWMPTYFHKALGLNILASGYFSFVPWLTMALGSLASGLMADSAVSNGVPVLLVRRVAQSIAFICPAIACLLLSNPSISPGLALFCFTLALGAKSVGQAGFVANTSDIAPTNTGKVYGLANMCGSLSGLVGTWLVGIIVEKSQSFTTVFQCTAAIYIFGTIVWNTCSRADPVL